MPAQILLDDILIEKRRLPIHQKHQLHHPHAPFYSKTPPRKTRCNAFVKDGKVGARSEGWKKGSHFLGPFFWGPSLCLGLLLPAPVLASASGFLLLCASRFLLCLSTLLAFCFLALIAFYVFCACCLLLPCASRWLISVAFSFRPPASALCFWACFLLTPCLLVLIFAFSFLRPAFPFCFSLPLAT